MEARTPESVRAKVKEILGNIANLDPASIADTARFVEDLDLDSLSMMEVGVDMDFAFRLGLPDESFQGLRSVDEAVALVLDHSPAASGPVTSDAATDTPTVSAAS